MVVRIRNDTWKCDEELKWDLEGYVKQALRRDEVLDFVSKKYPVYALSLRTHCCHLHYFEKKVYINSFLQRHDAVSVSNAK